MSVAACGGGMGDDGGKDGDEKKMRRGLAQVLDFVGSNDEAEDEDEDEDGHVPKFKSLSSILQALSQPNPNPNPNPIKHAQSSCMRRGISRKSKSFENLKEMGAGVKKTNPSMKKCRVVNVHVISPLPNITQPLLQPQHDDDDHNKNKKHNKNKDEGEGEGSKNQEEDGN